MKKRRTPWLALVGMLALLGLGSNPQAAGLLVAEGGFGGQLTIEQHVVEVTINNGIAVTNVDQIFRNTENRIVEALYTFPVPKGASVANFSMWINGKEMVGEVVEKQRARQIYDSYKQVRRDPGLLEQKDHRTFEMRIFPIPARAEQRVQISYYQELDFDHDWATYVYPLATTAVADGNNRSAGRFSFTLEIDSEVPLVALESPSHPDDMAVGRLTGQYGRASLEISEGSLERDVVVAYELSRPTSGLDLVASMERGEDGYFLMTLTPGEELGSELVQGADHVFVLDISGSMNDGGKLALSRNSVDAFIRTLTPQDRFEVVTFNVKAENLFGAMRGADEPSKSEAGGFLRSQRARGGTFLEPAIRGAYRYKDADRPLNVIILSDGLTEQRERQTLLALSAEAPPATRIFTIGVGNDVNRPLLEQLAEEAGGIAAFISRGDDFQRQAAAFRRKLERPVVSDLEIEIVGDELFDVEPRRLPNLYFGAPVRMYGRYRNPGTVRLTLRGNRGGELFEQHLDLKLPGEELANPEIERMWAWHRVQRLQKEADKSGSREAVLDEIVRLGEGFSIVTEYTSFLVLENNAEYQRWKIDRRNATRIERDRQRQRELRQRLDVLSKQAADLGPVQRSRPDASSSAESDPASQTSSQAPAATPPSSGVDVSFGGGGAGGGALDPLSLGIVGSLGALSAAAWRRRRRRR